MSYPRNDQFSESHPIEDQVPVLEGGEGDGEGTQDRQKPHQRILKSKGFIPTVVVVGLVLFVLLSSRLVGRPPQIDSITPTSGKPGDVMIITGHYFGSARHDLGCAHLGVSPTSSDYVEWTDTRISVTHPRRGHLRHRLCDNKNGRSGGLLFINRDQIPVLASGPAKPGEPYVGSIQPMAAQVGDTITISGMNFGLEKGESKVYFTWGAAQWPPPARASTSRTCCRPGTTTWTTSRGRTGRSCLRVPDGAASGNVLVTSDKGQSNSVYFEVQAGAGARSSPLPASIPSSTA